MNLIELDQQNYWRVRELGARAGEIHLSVSAVIEGSAEGEILVDSPEFPTFAVLNGPEGTYLLSNGELSDAAAQAIADHLDDWVYLHVPHNAHPASALPNAHMLKHTRLVFSLPLGAVSPVTLAEGYVIQPEPDGFGHRIFFGAQEVSRCLPDVILGSRAEIGVWTHPGHRHRGLAGTALRATMLAAKESGITRIGWHCHASNCGSIALALGVGAGEPIVTHAFSASLPAENGSDLSPDEWQRLGSHFLAGREEISWLGFHAACAFASAGDADAALDAVDRLVEDRWHGQPSWLVHNWALAPLADHPRMLAAVARLEKQKAPPG
jgi:hypothetical protein